MEPIPVAPYPFKQTFDSIESAVAHSMRHPLRPEAEADAARLKDSALVDAYWSYSACVLRFSNDQYLHAFIRDGTVRWQLQNKAPVLSAEPQFRIGAPPVPLDWTTIGVHQMRVSDLIAKRINSTFINLFSNHTGLFVYFRNHMVLQFNPAYRTDTEEDLLYVSEDD